MRGAHGLVGFATGHWIAEAFCVVLAFVLCLFCVLFGSVWFVLFLCSPSTST